MVWYDASDKNEVLSLAIPYYIRSISGTYINPRFVKCFGRDVFDAMRWVSVSENKGK
jgi:hypothetical protein